MTPLIQDLLRELTLAQRELPTPSPLPSGPAALRPGWGRRVSEARPEWIKQLPAVHALAPSGRLRLDRLFRPTPTHPDSERLNAAFTEWALNSGMYPGELAYKAAQARVGTLVYWIAPQCSLPVLWSVGTSILWSIAVDDGMIERGLPISDLKRASDDMIRSGETAHALTPASRYWLELRREVIELGGGELLPQIADATQLILMACEQEQRYIKDDSLPSLVEYLKQRTRTFFLQHTLTIHRCEPGLLPPHRHFCDRLRWLTDMASVLQALDNDILGYERDIEANFPMNVIPVMALEFRVDLPTAYLMSLDLAEVLKHNFDALVEDLCTDPGDYPEAAAMARAIAGYPDAFHTYHRDNGRYAREPAFDPAATLPPDHNWRSGPLLRALATRRSRDVAVPVTQDPPGEQAASAAAHSADAATAPVESVPQSPAPPTDFPPSIPVRWEPYRSWARTVAVDGVWVCEPRDSAEVVLLANWAHAQGFRLRASGSAQSIAPLTVTSGSSADKVLLVDTRKHLTNMRLVSADPAAVQAGVGASIEALLTFLEHQGYGLATAPARGERTIGGVLATGVHGTSVALPGQVTPIGHNDGPLSNLVVSLTAVVWDEASSQYVARKFDRSHPDCPAFLVNLGRTFLTDVTLRVGANQILRCISDTSLAASEVFGPADVPSPRRFGSMVQRLGRVEVLWFPYHDRTWVKTWTRTSGPSAARPALAPYNYPFTDSVPAPLSDLAARVMNGAPEMAPELSAQQYENIVHGLAATASADLVGPSKNLLLYTRSSTLRYKSSGYAICTRRIDLQRVMHEVADFYQRLLQEYQQRGQYPINGPLEVRASSIDRSAGLELRDAPPPALSSVAPSSMQADWDAAIWLNLMTFSGTPHANQFYREFEEYLFAHFRAPYALARPAWSQGWAYSEEGPGTDERVLHDTIPNAFGESWGFAKARLTAYDPHRVFSNDFLDRLL